MISRRQGCSLWHIKAKENKSTCSKKRKCSPGYNIDLVLYSSSVVGRFDEDCFSNMLYVHIFMSVQITLLFIKHHNVCESHVLSTYFIKIIPLFVPHYTIIVIMEAY